MFGGLQIEGRSICLVGSCSVNPYSQTEASNTIMEENEKINGSRGVGSHNARSKGGASRGHRGKSIGIA